MNKNRFIAVTAEFQKMIVGLLIYDYNWWFLNEAEVTAWCNEVMGKNWEKQGMIINFTNEEDRLQFLLRWGHE